MHTDCNTTLHSLHNPAERHSRLWKYRSTHSGTSRYPPYPTPHIYDKLLIRLIMTSNMLCKVQDL